MPFGEPLYDKRSTSYNSRYTFSGKERDTETGYSYSTSLRSVSSLRLDKVQTRLFLHSLAASVGARYYNSDLSIWLSVDPMSDKYPSLSPYTYCANNPVKLVDPNGEDIVLCGSEDNINSAIALMNDFFDTQTPVFTEKNGKVEVRGLCETEYAKMTEEQKSFYTTIASAIEDENIINIDVVSRSEQVFIGSYAAEAIDIGDITDVGEGEGMSCYSTFAHEIAEQHKKQTSGDMNSYAISHYGYGEKAENAVSGYTRGSAQLKNDALHINFYKSNDKTTTCVTTILQLNNNNIKSIQRNKTTAN